MKRVAIVGAGPAGLMAAEVLSQAGAQVGIEVEVFDAMPTAARKFLMAGKGGLNLTHSEPFATFVARYGTRQAEVEAWLRAFGPDDLRAWAHGLGCETFVGTSGRVFPRDMKAAPLLRAWLHRLREAGVRFHMRHRWLGWTADGALRLATPEGEVERRADALVLALGGGSWARLGSDGTWVTGLRARGVEVASLRPANCGFDVAWSAHFRERFAGEPLKSVALIDANGQARRGECVVTAHGVEGSLVYAFAAGLRDAIEAQGEAIMHLDLMPDWTLERVARELARPRGARSISSHLQGRLGLRGVKAGLLRECLDEEVRSDPVRLAAAIKALPIRLLAPRPLDEAISSAGGVAFAALNDHLMLNALPGVFCAGEMLDWEAPTGGYLLTACMASGRVAGQGALGWLRQ
ncbi:MAG: TIGR03862 family flavoprotein [Pseudomonadota bacterium]